jgi:hypothetical protein
VLLYLPVIWREKVSGQILGQRYCQTCTQIPGQLTTCKAKQSQELEQPPISPTPQPSGPAGPLQDGALEQPQQLPPSPDVKDDMKPQNDNSGVLQQQPDQGSSLKDNAKPPKGDDGGGSLDQGAS